MQRGKPLLLMVSSAVAGAEASGVGTTAGGATAEAVAGGGGREKEREHLLHRRIRFRLEVSPTTTWS